MPLGTPNDPRLRYSPVADGAAVVIGPDAAPNKSGMTTTTEDVIIGQKAGLSLPAVQTYQTMIGSLAGAAVTTGAGGVVIGQKSGLGPTTIQSSVIVGSKAGSGAATVGDDVFVGYGACASGNAFNLGRRVFVGLGAGEYDSGDYNIMIGWKAGRQNSANLTTADKNIGIGAQTLNAITGQSNIAIGFMAGTVLTSGSTNVMIGQAAGQQMTTGGANVMVGYQAGFGLTNVVRCIMFGVNAGSTIPAGSQNIFVAGSNSSGGGDRIDNVFFGQGYAAAAPTPYTINGTGGLGANIAGADVKIAGGKGTGGAVGGSVVIQVAPAGAAGANLNPLVDAITVTPDKRAKFHGATEVTEVQFGAAGPKWLTGAGTPEGVVVAGVGSLYTRTDGGAGTTLYVKESGAGNVGWVAK